MSEWFNKIDVIDAWGSIRHPTSLLFPLSVGASVYYFINKCGVNRMYSLNMGVLSGAITFSTKKLLFEETNLFSVKAMFWGGLLIFSSIKCAHFARRLFYIMYSETSLANEANDRESIIDNDPDTDRTDDPTFIINNTKTTDTDCDKYAAQIINRKITFGDIRCNHCFLMKIIEKVFKHSQCTMDLLIERNFFSLFRSIDRVYFCKCITRVVKSNYFDCQNEKHIKALPWDFISGIRDYCKRHVTIYRFCVSRYQKKFKNINLKEDDAPLVFSDGKIWFVSKDDAGDDVMVEFDCDILSLYAYEISIQGWEKEIGGYVRDFDEYKLRFINEKIIPNIEWVCTTSVLQFLGYLNCCYFNEELSINIRTKILDCINVVCLKLEKRELNTEERDKFDFWKNSKEKVRKIETLINKINLIIDNYYESLINELVLLILNPPIFPRPLHYHYLFEYGLKKFENEITNLEVLEKITLKILDYVTYLNLKWRRIPYFYKLNNEEFIKEMIIKYINRATAVCDSRKDSCCCCMPWEKIKTKDVFIKIIIEAKLLQHNHFFALEESLKIKDKLFLGRNLKMDLLSFHACKFFLHQMFDEKQKLTEDEFSKLEKIVSMILKNKFLETHSYPTNDDIIANKIPFLIALCNYFNPDEDLATPEMTGEIKKLIEDNIEEFIDIENTNNMQETGLYNALKKIECEKFCRKEHAEIRDKIERIMFIRQNSDLLYSSEEEFLQNRFTIRMFCNSFSFPRMF